MSIKVAISLSGLPRLNHITTASWSRIIGKYSADVYIHTWNDNKTNIEHLRDQLNWVFKPKNVIIDNFPNIDVSLYPDRHLPYTDVFRSLCMWTGIQRSYYMALESNINYDIFIRGRFDWHVHNLDIVLNEGITIPYDLDKLILKFKFKNKNLNGINDHFAYGKKKYMDIYVNTINEIYSLYKNDNIDYCPENFLAASLMKNNVPIIYQKLQHNLIRG